MTFKQFKDKIENLRLRLGISHKEILAWKYVNVIKALELMN